MIGQAQNHTETITQIKTVVCKMLVLLKKGRYKLSRETEFTLHSVIGTFKDEQEITEYAKQKKWQTIGSDEEKRYFESNPNYDTDYVYSIEKLEQKDSSLTIRK